MVHETPNARILVLKGILDVAEVYIVHKKLNAKEVEFLTTYIKYMKFLIDEVHMEFS